MSVVVVVVVAVAVVCCLSAFACACWCALSPKRPGARSCVREASHRRQYCCASTEDRPYCGVKLHLAACRSWVGRWDDGLGAVLLLRCCELFVVAVVVADVIFLLVSIYARLRVFGVLGHRRGTALGHPCRMPPTGANIAVLLLKTWLAPDSTYT